MIYKFKFEVVNDDNNHILSSRSEESGDFWKAFIWYVYELVKYALDNHLRPTP